MDNFEKNAHAVPMTSMQDVRCYTVEDLMAMLALSRPTVYRLLKQNVFRWFKVGGAYRISKASFDAFSYFSFIQHFPAQKGAAAHRGAAAPFSS